jgi:diguanylate cyclase (GGDEF)-like protein/PAS domain S-box-containing protein
MSDAAASAADDSAGLNPAGLDRETIRRGEELYRMLARQLPNAAVVVFDRQMRVLIAEGEALMDHGLRERHVEGQPLHEVMASETFADLESLYRAALAGERGEMEHSSPDGERCFRVFGKPMVDHDDEVWAGLVLAQDITSLRKSENALRERTDRLTEIATHDDLTGLPNRALFRDRLGHALTRAARHEQRLALMFVDLDRFKDVNDTLGHDAGDELLTNVATLLGKAVRAGDTVARLSGDEFVVLVEDIKDDTYALAAVERIFDALHAPVVIAGSELRVSASIGVAVAPRDATTGDALLAAADRAMYRAKGGGGNSHRFFDSTMHDRARERMDTETALQHALLRDEFMLHYQPAIDLQTGEVTSVEALVRWNRPEHGLVSPDAFIPIAEQTGLAAEITAWVLDRACRQARAWQHAGVAPLRVAVNSCSRELSGGLIDTVTRTLDATDLLAEQLEIEVTERFLGEDDDTRDEMLADLKALGVSIALDDFGTGYSSLARLRSFPVDVIKIDRQFISELHETGAIARTIIALAANLGLRVIAEGVEHDAQRAWLTDKGCDAASGYFICRPQPAEQLTPWLLSRQPG